MKLARIALLSFLLPYAADAAAATVSGTVSSGTVSSDAGPALAGMTVAAYTTAGALQTTGTTSSSGTYSLTVPAGTYHLLAYDPAGVFATSFYSDAESFETSAAIALTSTTQTASNINLRLVRAGYAAGHVTTSGGTPLPNITVAAYNPDGTRRGFTATDAAGAYTLALPPGTYRIAGYDDTAAWATTFFAGAAAFDAATPLSIVATQSSVADLQLPRAAKIAGTITDRLTLAPLASMRVTAYAADGTIAGSGTTGADGRFVIALRGGAYRFVVDDPAGRYAAAYAPDAESFSTATAFNAVAGQTLTLNASLQRGGGFSGTVRDAVTNQSPGSVVVAAYNLDGTVRALTSTSGDYTLTLPPGDYRLGVYDPALVYLPQFYSMRAAFDAADIVHVTADAFATHTDFALTKYAHASGVVSSRSGPVAGITVGAYDLSGRLLASATTSATGTYALALTPGTVKLLAFDPLFRYATVYYAAAPSFAASSPLPLAAGSSLTADFSVTDAGIASGTVVDAATLAPLAGMQVLAYDAAFNVAAETRTDAAGTFRLALAAGTYTLAAADPAQHYSGGTSASPFTVTAGQTASGIRIALTLPAPSPTARHRGVRH